MYGLGMAELAVIGGIALLIFGPKQLPKLARSVGETIRETRKATKDLQNELETPMPARINRPYDKGED